MEHTNKITKAIGGIGYDLIGFIEKEVGVSMVVADLYLVDVETYTENRMQDAKIKNEFLSKYGINADPTMLDYMTNWPIALIVLYVLENGNYKI